MRDLVSCYNEHAIKVADASCSSSTGILGNPTSCRADDRHAIRAARLSSSMMEDNHQTSSTVTCVYRSKPSSQECHKDLHLLIKVNWSKTFLGHGLSVAIDEFHRHASDDDDDDDASGRDHSFVQHPSLVLRKKKGNLPYAYPTQGGSSANIWLFWDVSSAKYSALGPEPIEGFYIVVIVDGECALQLGDEYYQQLSSSSSCRSPSHSPSSSPRTASASASTSAASVSLVSRREKVVLGVGRHYSYTTKARFRDDGTEHEISIRCRSAGDTDNDRRGGGLASGRDSELAVCVDRRKVVHVRRLRWNFRGNQTIFIDGFPVDLMWDVHDWCFSACSTPTKMESAAAVFMFRTRSALESRLWLEEDLLSKSGCGEGSGFSLVIQAFKASSSTS